MYIYIYKLLKNIRGVLNLKPYIAQNLQKDYKFLEYISITSYDTKQIKPANNIHNPLLLIIKVFNLNVKN